MHPCGSVVGRTPVNNNSTTCQHFYQRRRVVLSQTGVLLCTQCSNNSDPYHVFAPLLLNTLSEAFDEPVFLFF